MPTQHALLSASSSNRWIHCPPSVRLSENFENKSSDVVTDTSGFDECLDDLSTDFFDEK